MQHHAYIYEGSQGLLESLVVAARKEFGFEGEPIVEERKNSFNCNSTGGHFDICAGILPSEMLCLKGY